VRGQSAPSPGNNLPLVVTIKMRPIDLFELMEISPHVRKEALLSPKPKSANAGGHGNFSEF